jgi:hypothetical protein
MLINSSVTRRLLGGVVGVNLTLALAVSAGAVPRPGDNVQTAAATQVEELAAPAARQAGDTAPDAQVAQAAPAPEPTPTTAAPATTVAKPKVTTPPTTKAPKVAAVPKAAAPAPVVAAAPAPAPVVAAVTTVARRVPTAAEIQGVIAELKKRVPLLSFVSVSPAQIDQIGNQVCTAFDGGQTFAQVKVTGLSMIPAGVSVPAGTDDWAVRKAVALYCPGHANKLV